MRGRVCYHFRMALLLFTSVFIVLLFFGLPAFAIVVLMRKKVKKTSPQNVLTKPRNPLIIGAFFLLFLVFFSYFVFYVAITYTGNG